MGSEMCIRDRFRWVHLIQCAVHREFAEHDDLGDAQQEMAVGASVRSARSRVMTLAEASVSQASPSKVWASSSGLTVYIVLSLRGMARMSASEGMRSVSGGLGEGLTIVECSKMWSHHLLATKQEGGSCTQVSRPGEHDTGAPEGALRTATMECRHEMT